MDELFKIDSSKQIEDKNVKGLCMMCYNYVLSSTIVIVNAIQYSIVYTVHLGSLIT